VFKRAVLQRFEWKFSDAVTITVCVLIKPTRYVVLSKSTWLSFEDVYHLLFEAHV